jgi:hypothetical protein
MTPTAPQGPVRFANERLLPEVRERLSGRGHPIFDYGNFGRGGTPPTEWFTFGWEPRYASNYMGMRGMVSILSEAVSYRPFRTRLSATYWFVREIVAFAGEHAGELTATTRGAWSEMTGWGADPMNAPELGVRFETVSTGRTMGTWEVTGPDPEGGRRPVRTGRIEAVELEMYTRFEPTATRPFPAGYIVPVSYPEAVELLLRHGVVVEQLEADWSGVVSTFRVDSLQVAGRPYQGHRLTQVFGEYGEQQAEVPAGWYFVPCSQPLGALVFTLLEPEVPDGLAAWNFFDRGLSARRDAPVLKLMKAPEVPRRRLREVAGR